MCSRPQPHTPRCRSCWIRCADGSGISSCWQDRATPASRASARSAPHSHVPDGYQSRVSSGSAQVIAAPGAPGCLPRFLFFPASRCAARRCLRGGLRPGASSPDGGIEEFPLLRDRARSSRAACARSSASSAACPRSSASRTAIRSSRAAQLPQSGPGGGRSGTSHDHPQSAGSKQANTPGRLGKITTRHDHHPASAIPAQIRHRVNAYRQEAPRTHRNGGMMLEAGAGEIMSLRFTLLRAKIVSRTAMGTW